MPADILLGFSFDRGLSRYRNLTNGRFESRATIVDLLDAQVSSAERRLGALVTAAHEGTVAPSWFAAMMRDELRRAHLQNRALGAGGFDPSRMTQSDYGTIGRRLRDDYARVARLAQDMANGTVTLPQALNRMSGYLGAARLEYFEAERNSLRASGRRMEARRRLSASEHCTTCLTLAAAGWRAMEETPLPGDGSTECGGFDKCTIEYREVREAEMTLVGA